MMTKTKVETYEMEEVAVEGQEIEAREECQSLVARLVLSGQEKLLSLVEEGSEEPAIRCPYRVMTAEERFVWGQVCPTRTSIGTYAGCAMPLRVLQAVLFVREHKFFKTLEIWSAEAGADPLLVAHQGDYYDNRPFLLARWGAELDEWPALLKKAVALLRQRVKSTLAEIRLQITMCEASNNELDGSVMPPKVGMPTFYHT